MTIAEVISNINELDEETTIFAKRINGKFESGSETCLVPLPENDEVLSIIELSESYCPGFDYFLETVLVKEILEDMKSKPEYRSSELQIKQVIHYAENDAYLF